MQVPRKKRCTDHVERSVLAVNRPDGEVFPLGEAWNAFNTDLPGMPGEGSVARI